MVMKWPFPRRRGEVEGGAVRRPGPKRATRGMINPTVPCEFRGGVGSGGGGGGGMR